jgi:hypothetical protein
LTRFFARLPAASLAPLLVQVLDGFGVKTKTKSPTLIILGGYDNRKEKYKGRIEIDRFIWKKQDCCFVEMAREEVSLSLLRRMTTNGPLLSGEPSLVETALERNRPVKFDKPLRFTEASMSFPLLQCVATSIRNLSIIL